MRQTPRRLFVFLFALLQCLGPLLHAHVHAGGHGGVHLHGWPTRVHGDQVPTGVDIQAVDGFEVAINLPPCLQPRLDAGDAMPGRVLRLPLSLAERGRWPERPHTAVLPGPPSHLIPLPGAPPTA